VDANLLLALHALLEERNLTHAGERLTMSQPAMSGALARLRKHFDDELLVRTGRGFELSPLAAELRPHVAGAVEAAEALLGNQREFDPTSSTKRFAVSMSEYAMTVLAEPLTLLLGEQAPGCSVALDPIVDDRDRFESQLMRRDLIIGPRGFDFPGRMQPVFTDELVCLVADRDLSGTGVPVRWGDHPVTMPGGPALVARRSGAALIPAVCAFTTTGMRITFGAVVEPRPGREGLQAMTQEVATFFARQIGLHPEDWHMLQPFFPTRAETG